MRSRRFGVAAVLVVALTVALSSAAMADPSSGLRYQFSTAAAHLEQSGFTGCSDDESAGATIDFQVYFGRSVANASETMGPETWRDVDLSIRLVGCEGQEYELSGGTGGLGDVVPASQMWIVPLTSAALDDVNAEVQGGEGPTGVWVAFDVTWAVPPDASLSRDIQGGQLLQTNADAVLSGTVEVPGLPPEWGDSVTFVVGNDHGAFMSNYVAQ